MRGAVYGNIPQLDTGRENTVFLPGNAYKEKMPLDSIRYDLCRIDSIRNPVNSVRRSVCTEPPKREKVSLSQGFLPMVNT